MLGVEPTRRRREAIGGAPGRGGVEPGPGGPGGWTGWDGQTQEPRDVNNEGGKCCTT